MTAGELAALEPVAAASAILSWLPAVKEREVASEVHYYGAAHLIANALGLGEPPPVNDVAWHHGPNLPPLWGLADLDPPIPAGEMDYPFHSASRDAVRLLVRRKEEAFFASLGCTRYLAVGAPFLYAPASGHARIGGTLLAMPSHSFAGGAHQKLESARQYAAYLVGLRQQYTFVAVCLYGDDYRDPATCEAYLAAGLPVLLGAAIEDMGSLSRMRALFDLFDCMTSNDIGSHVFYASATGCRVFLSEHSLFGEKEAIWSKHVFYQKRPNVMRNVLRWMDPVWLRRQWPWLYQGPAAPVANKGWADIFLGTENKRSAEEIANLFGWRYPFDLPESRERFRRFAPRLGWKSAADTELEKAKREVSDLRHAVEDRTDAKQELIALKCSLAWKLAGKPLLSIEKRMRRFWGQRG